MLRAARTAAPQADPGGFVARAKRTERAEARRRYRSVEAVTENPDLEMDEADALDVPTAALPRSSRTRRAERGATARGDAAPPPRAGFLASLRRAAAGARGFLATRRAGSARSRG